MGDSAAVQPLNILFFLRLSEFLHDKSFLSCLTFQISFLSSLSSDPKDNKSLDESDEESYEPALNSLSPVHKERESEGILVEHHLSFFFYFYILEELYLMVHTFIIQILGFQELFLLLNGYSIYGSPC